jgi:hypothetical protein
MSTLASRSPQLHRALVVVPLLVLLAWGLGAFLASKDIETVRASVMLTLLVVASLMIFWFVAQSDPEGRTLFILLLVSFGLKLLATGFRFYGGLLADAFVYHQVGQRFALQLAGGQWPEMVKYSGTEVIRLATGLVYFVTGPTIYGISILWAWFGLIGMLFFYKAFSMAFPSGNRRLYMLLILLYPSMLLWTSSLGKDALMILFLGMASYGVARIQQRIELVGLWWLALGLGGTLMIRPHLAAVFAVAVAASALFRPIRAGILTPVVRVLGVAFFIAISAAVISTARGFVGLENLEAQTVLGFLDVAQERTEQGGSAFERGNPRNPLALAVSVPTILFRPFPWEAHSTSALIASLEGFGLLVLFLYYHRGVRAAIGEAPRNGLLVLTFVYALLFFFFFSAISNFGIIARQRAQLFPFVFMWIAYLSARPRAERRHA